MTDVTINGERYRIDIQSYHDRDVSDFSPRASTPGGGIVFSEMNSYQIIAQNDFRHGFGFQYHTDASGYLETYGNIDTRQPGVVTLFTAISAARLSAFRATNNTRLTHDAAYAIACGSSGAALITLSNLTVTQLTFLKGEVYDSWNNGKYTFLCPKTVGGTTAPQGRLLKSNDFTTQTGTASGGSPNTLVDADGTFIDADDKYNGYFIEITGGTGVGQVRKISDTVAGTKTITVSANWDTNPDATSAYTIWKWTEAGLDANANDFAWLMSHDGYVYANKYGTNEVHYASKDDLSDLDGNATTDTATIYVGTKGQGVVRSISYSGSLFFARKDALYKMDPDRSAARKTLDYTDQYHDNNFKCMAVYNGLLIFPVRNQLYQWNGTRVSPMTPARLTDTFPFLIYSNFKAMAVSGNYLIVVVRRNNDVQEDLIAFDGVGWHNLARMGLGTDATSGMCLVPGAVNTGLFFDLNPSYSGGSAGLYRFALSSTSDMASPPYSTTGSNYIVSSRYDAGFRRIIKSTPAITLTAGGCSAAHRYIKVYYSIDDGAWTAWGGTDGTTNVISSNGITELTNPLGSASGYSTIEYYWLQLRIEFVTDNSSYSPVLMGWFVKMMMRPDTSYGYSFNVVCAQSVELGVGILDERTPYEIITDLRTARDSKSPVEFIDIFGISHRVYVTAVQGVSIEEHIEETGGTPNIESQISVNLLEV